MSQMTLSKKNMKNLGLNPVWLVCIVLYWVGFSWLRIFFRRHDFWRWVMEWWRRVTYNPIQKIGEAVTKEFTGNFSIFSIGRISSESWIDPMFVEFTGMDWIELVWFGSRSIELEYFWFWFRINLVSFKFTIFLPKPLSLLIFLFSLRFSNRFLLSVLIMPQHDNPLMTISNVLLTKSKIFQLFTMVDSGIVVTMGPCGYQYSARI